MVNAGRILIMPKGDWNALTTYDMLDLVSYNGTAYLARQTNVGQNPSTDVSQTYWQPFGSASAIATTTAPGLVMPDGDTITVDGSGLIEVNIDNDTIVYDSVNGYLKANISSALANLTDVNVTSAQNGQALIYDNTSQKWENTTLYGDGIALSSLDATTITSKIGTLTGDVSGLQSNVGDLQAPTFTEASTRTNVDSGDNYTTLWGKVKKWFSDLKSGAFTDVRDDLTGIDATGSTNTTGSTISAGTYFYLDGVLVRAKANIANGATFTLNTNYEVVTAGALNELAVDYSLTERRVGTWIDGKPLYEVSFEQNTPIGQVGVWVTIATLNTVCRIKGINAYMIYSGGEIAILPYVTSSTSLASLLTNTTQNELRAYTQNNTIATTCTYFGTLQYTKTTD